MRKQKGEKEKRGLTGTQLKWVALVTMIIDHVGLSLVETGTALYWSMRLIGRLAFPLYCFLVVEGFCHTRDVKRYLARMGLFTLLSELPFDLMTGRMSISMMANGAGFTAVLQAALRGQNVLFTLLLGLAALKGYVILQNRCQPQFAVFWCVVMCSLAAACRTDYGWAGVALICFLYRFRQEPVWRTVSGYATLVLGVNPTEIPALLSFFLMDRYDGRRGADRFRWGFYVLYPLHMFILWLLCRIR